MSKKDKYEIMDTGEYLTEEQYKELQDLVDEMSSLSAEVVEDYELKPSEISGSFVEINENSPYLDETLKGNSWKKIIRGSVEEAISMIKKKDKNDTK